MEPYFEPENVNAMCMALADRMLLNMDIHPDPCPECGTRNLERDTWTCWECGRDRTPKERKQ